MPRLPRRRGDKDLRRGNRLEAAGMMFADPGLVKPEPIQQRDQLQVAFVHKRGVLVQRVEGRKKDAETQPIIGHGVTRSPFCQPYQTRLTRRTEKSPARRAAYPFTPCRTNGRHDDALAGSRYRRM